LIKWILPKFAVKENPKARSYKKRRICFSREIWVEEFIKGDDWETRVVKIEEEQQGGFTAPFAGKRKEF
jgi:hypothetical protein